jgi:hypothetical protein
VLKITTLDSPRRLGETLEGFMVPPKSADPIALTILEHILTTLGEEQRRDNNLYLRSRSVILGDLEIDKKNSKCYTTDVETRDKILKQRDILEMAVCVADILRFPEKSILVIEGMPQKFTKFFALYNLIQFAKIRPDKESKDEEKWLCEISLKELDPLWTWFETNDDVLFRVSLLLARMNVKDIDQELIKLRPSSGFQRQPSVFEPNQGYMSPRIPTPGAYSPRLFSQSPSRDDEDAESGVPRTRSTPVRSKKSKLAGKAESPQKEQNTTRKRTPLVSENRRKSNIQEEGEEEEEEPPAVLVVERTRRPYNVSVSQQESGKGPEVPTPTTRTGPTLGSSPFGSERRPYPGGGGNESTRSTPEGKGPVGPGRPYPGRGGSESTKSMPERRIPEETEKNSTDTRDRRRPKESMRTGQNAYVPEEFSSDEDSDEETRRPGPYRPPSPPPVTSRNYARFQGPTAPMPEAYPRTDDSYRPHAGVRERFGSFSERRESEPAFHPENPYNPRYSEPPPKPYRYPYPARRQYPFQNSSDSTGW